AIELMLPERLPTAFVCNCDETAFRLVKTLKAKGIRVPEDISVVGFDDDIYAELCEPALTTVAVNIEEIGKVAAKRMMRYMERTRRRPGEVFRILGKIIYRDSVKEIKE
ncbi:MAG: substrate-binding domain-containing protein, partial [Blautia hansenii]